MSTRSKQALPAKSPRSVPPIELLTENGFRIVRAWEIGLVPPPIGHRYSFLIYHDERFKEPREIVVEIGDAALCDAAIHTCGRIDASHTFWICCAERHLANYTWENDECPPEGVLRIDQLSAEDFDQAMRWVRK